MIIPLQCLIHLPPLLCPTDPILIILLQHLKSELAATGFLAGSPPVIPPLRSVRLVSVGPALEKRDLTRVHGFALPSTTFCFVFTLAFVRSVSPWRPLSKRSPAREI